VAALVLFVHWPLLFDHGLRSNNMEGPLFLSYCGGVFHALAWASADERGGRRHAIAATLYFVLGFMTKFVAAAFLPLLVGLAVLAFAEPRRRLIRDWRLWAGSAGLALALIAPWFVFATVRFGTYFWHVILAEHVLTRFRTYLNPAHVQPWSFYFTQMFDRFSDSGSEWLVVAGFAVLAVQTVRRRWFDGAVVVLWAVVPLFLISAGTSKLYHYAYPFLPPVALGAGYLAALVVAVAPAPLRRLLQAAHDRLVARIPWVAGTCARSPRLPPWWLRSASRTDRSAWISTAPRCSRARVLSARASWCFSPVSWRDRASEPA
jgi:4-amino-4-deoxy-L-arabinose transferase-like glycosyltransferase